MKRQTICGLLCVLGGFLYFLAIGYFYTVGNMNPYVISYMGIKSSESAWFASVILAVQAIMLPVGGILAKKIGLHAILITALFLAGSGILLTRLTIDSGLGAYIVTYCILFGMGMGLPYSVILQTAGSWFPQYRATVVGVISAGFGLGALVFTPIQSAIINPDNLSPNRTKFPSEIEARIPQAYLILGGILVGLEVLGIIMMREVPTSVTKEEFKEGETAKKEPPKMEHSLTIKEAFKAPDFYLLAFVVFFDVIPVVLFSSTFKVFGIRRGYDDKFLSIVATVSSAFNCGGRVIWGLLVDRFSSKCPLLSFLTIWAALFITFPFAVVAGGQYVYAIYVFAIFFQLSAHFVIIPAACSRIFGPANMAAIFGFVYAATAPSALLTAGIVSQFHIGDEWAPVYITCGVCCLISFLLALFVADKDVHCVGFTSFCADACNPCRTSLQVHGGDETDEELEVNRWGEQYGDVAAKVVSDKPL